MTRRITFGLVALSAVFFGACEIFEDLTPREINVRMTGQAGQVVQVLYTKQFVAGVDEVGVTRVEIFGADSVMHTLPFDTVIDVRLEQRLYIQAEPVATDTVSVDVDVDVDGRTLFDRMGDLFPGVPWQVLYQFNHVFTDNIEIVL